MPATPDAEPADTPTGPRIPRNLSVVLPEDVAALLHLAVYQTGRSKQDLVSDAIRRVYGDKA